MNFKIIVLNSKYKMKKLGVSQISNPRRQQHSKNVKISPFSTEKVDHQNLSYLILTQDQIELIHRNQVIRLQAIIKKINQTCFFTKPQQDPILKQLQKLNIEARNYQFADIQKGILLVQGKRLLNLAIQQKKKVQKKKLSKKQQMEDYMFRSNKIKKFNYQELLQLKLQDNTYISPAYPLGEGFQETQSFYINQGEFHLERLQQCKYFQTVKEVNRIYMKNYKSCSLKQNISKREIAFIIVAILCIVPFSMGIFLYDSDKVEYIIGYIVALLMIIMIVLTGLGLQQYLQKPNENNQFEQTKEDVREYFQKINSVNIKKGKKYIWGFEDKFMYLQVKFKQQ